jgi:RNA polymerase sigma factor (sigma-70 family)
MTLTDHATVVGAEPTDADCMARSRTEPRAFGLVFDRHWLSIHAFCVARVGGAGEDLAAEVFRTAFSGRHRYDAAQPDARPWLYGIATNLVREHLRSAGRRDRALARAAGMLKRSAPPGEPLGRLEARQLGPELAAALGALEDCDRDTLLLLAWAELDYEEIARALDVPVGTVRSRIHRARRRVRDHLNDQEHR